MERALAIAQRLADGERIDWNAELAACADDEREEIEALRALSQVAQAQQDAQSDGQAALPEQIGEFRVLRRLGEGGMGVVLEAEQQSPKRQVALKILRGGIVTQEQARMFRREIQSLALLSHPGIASIYASGTTADGQQWFAMELVRGRTLREWLAARPPLDRDELSVRLQLFLATCDAVAYAHQRGVIHRDLKPSNILVVEDEAPLRPKVLDFGLARITESDVAAASLQTQVGRIQGTLYYMSPEQAAGNAAAIDLRSDVYSLGVVLYQLLTGELPYDFQSGELFASLRAIAEQEPRRLRSAWPSALRLDVDLETIVAKALAKAVDARYASVHALADDLRRYRAQQPIQARPASTAYQLQKLLARHRLVSALLATLLLALLGFSIGIARQARIAAQERDRAQQEAAAAQRAANMMVDLFALSDPMQRRDAQPISAEAVLEAGVEQLQSSQQQDPLLRARLLDALGRSFVNLSRYDRAEPLLREALALREQHLPAAHADLARSRSSLARMLFQLGRYEEADPLARQALDALRAGEADPVLLSSILHQLGTFAMTRADYEAALPHFQEAAQLLESDPSADPAALGERWLSLGQLFGNMGRPEEAEPYFKRALTHLRTSLAEHHPHQLFARTAYAMQLLSASRLKEAEAVLNEALVIIESGRYGAEDRYVAHVYDVAVELDLLRHDAATAAARAERSLAICSRIFGEHHPRVAYSWTQLGRVHAQKGQREQAKDAYRRALSIYDEHPTLAPEFRAEVERLLAETSGR